MLKLSNGYFKSDYTKEINLNSKEMRESLNLLLIGLIFILFNGCNLSQDKSGPEKEGQTEFKGIIAKTYEESEESWPEKKRPPEKY